MPKILFVHNTIVWYTEPLFIRLSKICDIKFIFTHMQLAQDVYGAEARVRRELNGMKYKIVRTYFKNIGHTSFPGIPLGLIKDLLREHYDVLVADLGTVDTPICYLMAKLRRKPVIFWSGDWGWEGKYAEKDLSARLSKFILPRLDAMVVPGTKHKEYFVSLGTSPERIFIIPYASNITFSEEDYENKEKIREKLDIGNKKVILYTGRLVKRKGVEYLIEAFARLRKERDDVVLVVVGEGGSRSELESHSRSLGMEASVYFTGFVDNFNLAAYYLLCDVCVVPSITHVVADIWVHVVNDAMEAGKPVIATDAVGAAFDMVKDGVNGFVVLEKDSDALYQAIKRVISEPELAKKMGEAAKRIVEQGFKYEHMADGLMAAVDFVSQAKRK
jgi:glycosyltransferase involved in cell wall biosynthesis